MRSLLAAALVVGAQSASCPAALADGQILEVVQSSESIHDPVRDRDVPALFWKPTTGGNYPLVLLNHGAGTGASGYTYLGSAMAARGYVVAAFDEYSVQGTQLDYMLDTAALRDSLRTESADSSSKFSGLLCDKAIGVGHSLGGGTQFVSADSEVMKTCNGHTPCNNGGYTAEIDGLAALSGGFVFDGDPFAQVPEDTPDPFVSAARLEIPVMFISGTSDCMVKPLKENYLAYESMTKSPCRIFSNITGADHCQFEKQGFLAHGACTLIEKTMGCSPGISQGVQQDMSVKYVNMFADYVTKGSQDAMQSLMTELGTDASGDKLSFESAGCSALSVAV